MTPTLDRACALARFAGTVSLCIAAMSFSAIPRPAFAGDVPTFAVDASWPKPLPNNWIIGQVGGRNAGQFHWIHAVAVDKSGNVYTGEVDNAKRIQKFKLTNADALR